MPKIRNGEEGVEEGGKGKGEVKDGIGTMEEVKEGLEDGKEGGEKRMAEVHYECSGVNASGETTRGMKVPHL